MGMRSETQMEHVMHTQRYRGYTRICSARIVGRGLIASTLLV